MMLKADLIATDGDTQPRANIDVAVVEDYAAQIAAGAIFPQLIVFHDGETYWLADGFHRYHARVDVLGELEIDCDVRSGSRRDAVLFAVGANAAHGLRRTNEDKRRAVMILLQDEEWKAWSDSEIARRCAVGHSMVSDLRRRSPSDSESERRYRTRHGTEATMDISNLGRNDSDAERDDPGREFEWNPRLRRCPECGQVIS